MRDEVDPFLSTLTGPAAHNAAMITLDLVLVPLLLAGVGLWAVTARRNARISVGQALLIGSAALATATSALGWEAWHWLFKPLTMLIAILLVTRHRAGLAPGREWLLAALAASLAGDVFLMFDGFFIPGLVSFLTAHLAYLGLLRRDAPWFAHRGALAATLCVGAAMYAFLWAGGLPAPLRAPVAVYVTVIALMAAQALGRARVQGTPAARTVAVGAMCFMLSDAVLATNRFVQPLPLAQLWVLATYYAAQWQIVDGWMRTGVSAPPARR